MTPPPVTDIAHIPSMTILKTTQPQYPAHRRGPEPDPPSLVQLCEQQLKERRRLTERHLVHLLSKKFLVALATTWRKSGSIIATVGR